MLTRRLFTTLEGSAEPPHPRAVRYRKLTGRAGCLFVILLVLTTATSDPCLGQAEPEELEVTLRGFIAFPGGPVRTPLYLSGRSAGSLESLTLELRFPAALLEFESLEEGFLLDEREVQVEREVRKEADQDIETAVLVLHLTSPDGIPEGLLVRITFSVNPSAPHGAQISLNNRAQALRMQEGNTAEVPVAFSDAIIAISKLAKEGDEPLFSCFFYMH